MQDSSSLSVEQRRRCRVAQCGLRPVLAAEEERAGHCQAPCRQSQHGCTPRLHRPPVMCADQCEELPNPGSDLQRLCLPALLRRHVRRLRPACPGFELAVARLVGGTDGSMAERSESDLKALMVEGPEILKRVARDGGLTTYGEFNKALMDATGLPGSISPPTRAVRR